MLNKSSGGVLCACEGVEVVVVRSLQTLAVQPTPPGLRAEETRFLDR